MTERRPASIHLRLSLVVALALAAVSGCSAPEPFTAQEFEEDLACASFLGDPADLIEVSVAVLGNAEPLLVWGEQQGCFSEQGISVSVTKVANNASAVAGLVSNTWDVISLTPFTMLQAEANSSVDLAVVAPWYGYTQDELLRAQVEPLFEDELLLSIAVVAKDPEIRGWEDLVGKLVSVSSVGGVSEAALNEAMFLNTGREDALSLISLPNDEAIVALIDREQTDAAILTGLRAIKAIENGAHVVGYPGAYFYEPGPANIFVSSQNVSSSDEVRSFQNAIVEINKLLNSGNHSASYRQVIVGELGFSEDVADEMEKIRLDTEPYSKESFEYLVAKMKAQGLIDESYILTASSFLN